MKFYLNKIDISDEDFTPENYKPSSSGESSLYRDLLEKRVLSTLLHFML